MQIGPKIRRGRGLLCMYCINNKILFFYILRFLDVANATTAQKFDPDDFFSSTEPFYLVADSGV